MGACHGGCKDLERKTKPQVGRLVKSTEEGEDREGSPGSEGAPRCGKEARMGDDREMQRRKKVSGGGDRREKRPNSVLVGLR